MKGTFYTYIIKIDVLLYSKSTKMKEINEAVPREEKIPPDDKSVIELSNFILVCRISHTRKTLRNHARMIQKPKTIASSAHSVYIGASRFVNNAQQHHGELTSDEYVSLIGRVLARARQKTNSPLHTDRSIRLQQMNIFI